MTKTKSIQIAFQGTIGSYSQQAAALFGNALGDRDNFLMPCQSFGEVFESVERSENVFGAIPLENSSMGSISVNYDLFWHHSVVIVRELFLPVHHTLIALPTATIDSIKKVYSHPAALEQCRNLFKEHPSFRAIPHWDTSASVLLVKESGDSELAAIASENAAKERGLKILCKNVEDFSHNTTRFGLIAHIKNSLPKPKFPHKISAAFEVPHKPGALADVLNKLAQSGINLTTIESRPIPEQPWHYRFFVDIEVQDKKQSDQLAKLLNQEYATKFLGRYSSISEKS